jgi:hypothetical protein
MYGGPNGRTFTYTDCDGISRTVNIPAGDSLSICHTDPYPPGDYIGPC